MNGVIKRVRGALSSAPYVSLCFEEEFLWRFACLGRSACGGWIPKGDDDDRLFVFRQFKQFVAQFGIEITYPTRAKSLLCSCQTKMLDCNGDINIAVRFAICPNPFLVMKQGRKHVQRRFVEPGTWVAGLKLCSTLLTSHDSESPRLLVHGRRSESHTLLEVRNFLFLYCFVEITATAVAAVYYVEKALQLISSGLCRTSYRSLRHRFRQEDPRQKQRLYGSHQAGKYA